MEARGSCNKSTFEALFVCIAAGVSLKPARQKDKNFVDRHVCERSINDYSEDGWQFTIRKLP